MSSPVFEAMFFGGMAMMNKTNNAGPASGRSSSCSDDNVEVIKILDVSPEAFAVMLEWVKSFLFISQL